jgi:hypothetical protein
LNSKLPDEVNRSTNASWIYRLRRMSAIVVNDSALDCDRDLCVGEMLGDDTDPQFGSRAHSLQLQNRSTVWVTDKRHGIFSH